MPFGPNITPGFAQVTFDTVHAGMGHTAKTVIGFEVGGTAPTQTNWDTLLQQFGTACKTIHDSEVSYPHLVAIHNRAGTLERWEATSSIVGSAASNQVLPPQVSYLIKKTTLLAGRRYRGRIYLPYVNFTDTNQQGHLQPSGLAFLTTVAANLKTDLVTPGTGMQNIVLLHSANPPSLAPIPTIVGNLVASPIVATQRRRLLRT